MKKIQHFLQAAAFCLLLCLAVSRVSGIVERKESIVKYGPFLDAAGEYDVLFMGNSHVVNGVFPMELWEKHGIASYNVAGYGNTIPVSYWAMINAFDYARPRLMVIDISGVSKENKLTGSSGDLHKAMDCYPLSLSKIRALRDLIDDPHAMDDEGNLYMDMKWEYYMPLGKYHSRWNDLSESDFVVEGSTQKGAERIIGVAKPREYEISEDGYATTESGWGFVYLRRMIEACQERGIEVLLTHMPYPAKPYQQEDANAVRYIAAEYGVNFVDFVCLDQVVDYETDLYDSFSHLNVSGARKVTDYLGRYIREHYAVPDRRQDARYSGWHEEYAVYARSKAADVQAQSSVHNALMLMHDCGYDLRLYADAGAAALEDWTTQLLVHNIAREHVFEEDEFVKYSGSMYPLTGFDDALYDYTAYFLTFGADGAVQEYLAGEADAQYDQHFGAAQERPALAYQLIDPQTGVVAAQGSF